MNENEKKERQNKILRNFQDFCTTKNGKISVHLMVKDRHGRVAVIQADLEESMDLEVTLQNGAKYARQLLLTASQIDQVFDK